MFTIQTERPLPASSPDRYTGMAYDGVSFYFSKGRECKIYQYTSCLEPIGSFDTCRSYASICFDQKERCFWASSDECRAMVFKLDSCFKEIDCYPVFAPDHGRELGYVTGITYDSCCDRLIVAFAWCVICVDKYRREKSIPLIQTANEWILGVLSMYPYIICNCIGNGRQTVRFYTSCGELYREYPVPCNHIRSAVLMPSSDDSDHFHLAVLVSRGNCYSYVLDCTLPCHMVECHGSVSGECEQDCSDMLKAIALLEKHMSEILAAEGDHQQKILARADTSELLAASRSVHQTLAQVTCLQYIVYNMLEEYIESSDESLC